MAEVAASDAGNFNPDKVRDQLRVCFQASQVRKRKKIFREKDAKRPRRSRKGKRDESLFTTSDEDEVDEELRDDSAFQNTLVPFDKSYLNKTAEDPQVDCKDDDESN